MPAAAGILASGVAFAGGICVLLYCPLLPPLEPLCLLPGFACWLGFAPLRIPGAAMLGFAWALWFCETGLEAMLPPELEGRTLIVAGEVLSTQATEDGGRLLLLHVQHTSRLSGRREAFGGRVRLRWYTPAPEMLPGQFWRLQVRLRRPHGFYNPGGFDAERYALQRRVRASGYVRRHAANLRLRDAPVFSVRAFRDRLAAQARTVFAEAPHAELLVALGLGLRTGVGAEQWQVLRATGTMHLLAISGLHIGMLAWWVVWLTRSLWCRLGLLALRWPASYVSAAMAFPAAAAYALLAGMELPVQRALVMLGTATVILLLARRAGAGYGARSGAVGCVSV